jgi:hypothetical protein
MKLIVVKANGIESGEVCDAIAKSVQKLSKFSIECFVNAFNYELKLPSSLSNLPEKQM